MQNARVAGSTSAFRFFWDHGRGSDVDPNIARNAVHIDLRFRRLTPEERRGRGNQRKESFSHRNAFRVHRHAGTPRQLPLAASKCLAVVSGSDHEIDVIRGLVPQKFTLWSAIAWSGTPFQDVGYFSRVFFPSDQHGPLELVFGGERRKRRPSFGIFGI